MLETNKRSVVQPASPTARGQAVDASVDEHPGKHLQHKPWIIAGD